DTIVILILCFLICVVVLLLYQLVYTLLTDDFRFFEAIPGFLGLIRFGQAVDHTFFERFSYFKHRMDTCTSSASDLDDDVSTLSDADPEHGEYKT
ncbi:hypothetical protein PMAYCL1PPCAC_25068, partial [Pristionchus mayeri]